MHMEFPEDTKFWIMGVNFFHAYYTVFDPENKRVGFGRSINADKVNSTFDYPIFLKEGIIESLPTTV